MSDNAWNLKKIWNHISSLYVWFFIRKRGLLEKIRVRREYHKLLNSSRLAAPDHIVKQRNILAMAKHFSCSIFVETGTFHGDMVYAMKDSFEEIYSIELSTQLHQEVLERFKNIPNIHLLCGDSASILPGLLQSLKKRTVFWLDAHYCGGENAMGNQETPILNELDFLLKNETVEPVIIIDDARLFHGCGAYPTFEEIRNLLHKIKPDMSFDVRDDAIFILPAEKQHN